MAKVLFAATSGHLPSHLTSEDGRATDKSFALIGNHQCGILIVDAGWLATFTSTPSETQKQLEADSQNMTEHSLYR